MRRFFALILLTSGLLSILSASLISRQRREDAPPLEWLYYISLSNSGQFLPYRTQIDATITQNLLRNVKQPASYAAFSPDKQWLFFRVDQNGIPEIYRLSLDGKIWQNLTNTPDQSEFVVSWNGDWLLFNRFEGDNADIYRMRIDGSSVQNLSQDLEHNKVIVTWTSDGEWVFWKAYDAQGQDMGLMGNQAGGQPQQILADTNDLNFVNTASDSRALYFSTTIDASLAHIHRLDLSSAGLSPLYPTADYAQYFAADSPDGQWLYYNQIESMESVLYAQDLSSSAPPIRLSSSINPMRPFFSPDGLWMLVEVQDREGSFLYRLRPDGSEKSLIATDYRFVNWINDTQAIITQARSLYRLDLDGTRELLLPVASEDLRLWWVSGEWFFYQYTSDGVYYRMHLDTRHPEAITLEGQIFSFLDLQTIPPRAHPYQAGWLGGVFLLAGIFLAYRATHQQKLA